MKEGIARVSALTSRSRNSCLYMDQLLWSWFATEQLGWNRNSSDLHWEITRFERRPGHRLLWLSFTQSLQTNSDMVHQIRRQTFSVTSFLSQRYHSVTFGIPSIGNIFRDPVINSNFYKHQFGWQGKRILLERNVMFIWWCSSNKSI
jgi:hypothetical protein